MPKKTKAKKVVAVLADREPMGAYVALSAAQLDHAGVPPEMTSDELAECIDRALLEDDSALQWEVQQWIEDRERA